MSEHFQAIHRFHETAQKYGQDQKSSVDAYPEAFELQSLSQIPVLQVIQAVSHQYLLV